MGRKKPPGARRRGPTGAAPFDEFGMDPRAVMHRMANLKPIVGCLEEHHYDVLSEAREYLARGEWSPPLGNFSLMAGGGVGDDRQVLVSAYGLTHFARWALSDHLVRHENAELWGVWDAVE